MFDYIRCKYPLPVEGANDLDFQAKLEYQTTDIPKQFLDVFEIREDGTLWVKDYDFEDQSERGKWLKDHPGEPEPPFDFWKSWVWSMTPTNERWLRVEDFIGEIVFYTSVGERKNGDYRWIEFSAYFNKGQLKELNLIKNGD